MGAMSKRKGAAGEREAAAEINRVLGTHLHRGRQYHGGPGTPDVTGDLQGIHLEIKRTERFALYGSLDQAKNDAGAKIPVVVHRASRKPWVVVVELDRLVDLVNALKNQGVNNAVPEVRS